MKASLRSVRIAPKKANLIAKMIRGMSVAEARNALEHTHKKAARIFDALVASAAANAQHNEKQSVDDLVIRSVVVNKAQAYHRGVPMARGRVRPMRKFLSHIELTLGVEGEAPEKKVEKKDASASQTTKKTAESAKSAPKKATGNKGTGASKKQTSPRSSASAAKKSSSSSK